VGVRSRVVAPGAEPSAARTPARRPVALPIPAIVASSKLHASRDAFGFIAGLQRTAGNKAVQRLVRLTRPPAPPGILAAAERRAFVRTVFSDRRMRARGFAVMEDMASASDLLEFHTPAELEAELGKRVTMSAVMEESQASADGMQAFGYPFTGRSSYWGPRVNAAARAYWEPPVVDDYDLRRDPAKRREIRSKPRHERHTVYGDPAPHGYEWRLTPLGRANPYQAILRLFTPQPPHKRSLVHCDYLVSLVHFRAFMASLGSSAFSARVAAYGPDRIRLRWNLFTELEPATLARPGLGSIRRVVPSGPADLVIGDHVYFMNHPAYDVINRNVGNAWRLENAVLVSRRSGQDIFLGHGSGHKTAHQMRSKLAEEYNDVGLIALRLVRRTQRGRSADRAAARSELATRFPGVVDVGGTWRIRGTGLLGIAVDIELKLLRASDIPGLRDPRDMSRMYPVIRPAESA
jgi:hypothetical protein